MFDEEDVDVDDDDDAYYNLTNKYVIVIPQSSLLTLVLIDTAGCVLLEDQSFT
jgi:hypothetical protein